MKRAKIIQLNKKKIFLCDLKGLAKDDILNVSKETWSLINSEVKSDEKVSFLIDITDVNIPPKIMEEIAFMAEQYKNNIDKEGVIGIHGFRKKLLNLYGWVIGSQLRAFEDKQMAMHWLAS